MKGVYLLVLLAVLSVMAGCARDGNLKEAAYETIRGINNMQQPGVGETHENEWNYREYRKKRAPLLGESVDDRKTNDEHQPPPAPEWLIDPNR